MGVKNAAVYMGRKYGRYIRVLGTHYLYRQTIQLKRIAVLYGPYIRVLKYTRMYGPYIYTGSIYG